MEREREKEKRRRKREWAWWLWLLLLLLLLLLLGNLGASIYTAAHVPQPTESACCSLFAGGQAPAQSVAFSVIGWLAVFLDDVTTTTQDEIVNSFNANGTWSTVFLNAQGSSEIIALLNDYYFSNYEFFVTNTIHQAYWDYTQSTLTVEYLHEAFTGDDRYMYDDSFVVTSYPPETPFAQDRATIFKFDCSYRIVYMRTYFDNLQRVSTFTTDYPDPCSRCTGTCVTQQHLTAAQKAVMRGARAQNALIAHHGPKSAAARQLAIARVIKSGDDDDSGSNSTPSHPVRPSPDTRRPKPNGIPVHERLAL